MKHKRLLSLLLAVCMVLALLPAVAAAETSEITDTLNREFTGRTGTGYGEWTGTGTSGAVYAGQSAAGNDAIQLKSKNSNSGIVTTVSGGKATKVVVVWNSNTSSGATLDIYGKSSAYSAPTDLYGNSTQGAKLGSIVMGTSTELTISGDYEYIGMRSNSGAMWLDEIDIIWSQDDDTPPAPTYTVSFDANGGEGSMEPVTKAENSVYTVPANGFTAPEGYRFIGWKVDNAGDLLEAGTGTITITGNVVLYAHWAEITYYTVTFNPGENGTVDPTSATTNDDGKLDSLPVPTWTGHNFDGWFTEAEGGTQITTDTVFSANATVYAHWNTYTIDTLTKSSLGITATSYANGAFSGKDNRNESIVSEAVYAGCAITQSTVTYIQMRSSDNNGGIVSTTSGGKVKSVKITVDHGSGTIDVYGSNTAYSGTAASALYGDNAGTKVGSLTATGTITFTDDYTFVGIRPSSGTVYITSIEIDWEPDTSVVKHDVSFAPGEGDGESYTVKVEDGTSYELPECEFTAPEGKRFKGWSSDSGVTFLQAHTSVTVTAPMAFVAYYEDIPYTDMQLTTSPAGKTVVLYYPAASTLMTATEKQFTSSGVQRVELQSVSATLTNNNLKVPEEALRLTASVDDNKYTFSVGEGESTKYLYADSKDVKLVTEPGANTLFQLERIAGTDNYYIMCDTAKDNDGNALYIEYYSNCFTAYKMTSSAGIFQFQFFAEDGEGPTPITTYTVTLDPGEIGGDAVSVEDVTSPYTLPECPFTVPEGKAFVGWTMNGSETVYGAGEEVAIEGNTTFVATWKNFEAVTYQLVTSESDLVNDGTYLITSGLIEGELYVMSKQSTGYRKDFKVSNVEGNTVTLDKSWIAQNASDDLAFEFKLVQSGDNWSFYDEVSNGYLAATSSESNNLGTQAELDDNGKFSIAFEDETGATAPVAQGTYTHNIMRHNADYNRFSCYGDTSSLKAFVYLYKLVEPEPLADGFYLLKGKNWNVDEINAEDQFGANVNAGGEYILAATLAEGDQIKVVKVENGAIVGWYPDGIGTQYTVDAAHAGNVNIYFRESYNDGWSEFGGYFYIEAGYNITCVSGEHGLVSTTQSRAAAGATVTVYLEAEDDYEVDTLTVMCSETAVETTKVNDWQYTFVMPAGDVTITATFAIPATEPTFKSQSLILDGMIGVSFNMELPEMDGVDYSTSYMTFSIAHGTCTERVNYSAAKAKRSNEVKGFICYVSAVQMAEPITATFHYTQNGTEKTVEKVYAVKDYFTAYDKNKAQFNAKTQALIESVADYGHYAQAFLATQKGWTFGEDGDYYEMGKFYKNSYDISSITSAVENKGITCTPDGTPDFRSVSFALVCDSATEIRILFSVSKSYAGTFTATVDNDPFDVTMLGQRKAIQIANVPAHELSKTYTIVVTTDNGGATIQASALSYVKILLAAYADNSAALNAAAAIYGYSAAADAYNAGQ